MTRPVVLGLDPGFASFGWALVLLGTESAQDRVHGLGAIRTVKADKLRGVRSTDDNVERAREIDAELRRMLHGHRVVAIAAESMSFVRSSAVMAKIGMAWGVTVGLACGSGLPLLGCTPQELKRAVCGRLDASKAEVAKALDERYGIDPTHWEEGWGRRVIPPSQREHPYDALGAVVACLETDTIRMARQLARVDAA